MGPARTGKGKGAYQFDRVFPGIGRIKKSSGTIKLKEFRKRDDLLTKLFEASAVDVLRAFKAGQITIESMIDADRGNNASLSLDRLAASAPLWPAVKDALPRMGKSAATRSRYKQSLEKLQKAHAWTPLAKVGDLATVDWRALNENHMRRAVSHFLTVHLKDKYHPLRRAIVAAIPTRKEVARTPDQNAELFLKIVEQLPLPAQPCFMALALTGMRIGEYLTATHASLRPQSHSVAINGKSGEGIVYLTPEGYAVVAAAIPCPLGPPITGAQTVAQSLRYGRMRRLYRAAQKAAGVKGLRLHDIRHLFGQTAADAGVPTSQTQAQLRHTTSAMTRRYEIPAQARMAATSVAKRLGLVKPTPKKKKA
jgi:integrase